MLLGRLLCLLPACNHILSMAAYVHEYASQIQVITATITWKEYAELPTKVSEAKTTVVNGKVYCGGGVAEAVRDANTVYCYDVKEDKWSDLPPLPVKFFGLGRISTTLVAVGGTRMNAKGMKKDITNEVYTYNEQLQKWEAQTIPPMPTARQSPGVLSHESALIIAGGFTDEKFANTVEIFQPSTLQWYRTDPLPIDCCDVSMVAIGSQCYVVGGFKEPACLNQVLYASVDDLLHNAHAVPAAASQTAHSATDHETQTAWRKLPDTPIYRPASATLAGYLLAVGGSETSDGGADIKAVYAYSPHIESWIYISNMPLPVCEISVNTLSPVEILVIGGQRNNCRLNEVYKGTLNLKL